MTNPQRTSSSAPAVQATGITASHILLGLCASLLMTGVFAYIWEQVEDKRYLGTVFDREILTWMHSHQVPWITAIAQCLAFFGSPPVIVSLGIAGAVLGLFWQRVRGAAWTLPLAILGAGALIQGMKLEFRRPRPSFFHPLLHETGYSFPSGHSLIAMVVYGLFGYFALSVVHRHGARLAVRIITVLIVFLIGVSRPYVQVHYPTDVLAGWTAGFPWLLACIWLHEHLARRFAVAGKPVLSEDNSSESLSRK
jgi:undecaprenyl-diphosphatase